MTERVQHMQDVYDLIIRSCQHHPEFHAWGASALRFLNKRQDTQGMPPVGPRREGGSDASASASPVRQDAPNPLINQSIPPMSKEEELVKPCRM